MIPNNKPVTPEVRLFQLKDRVTFLLKAFAMFNFRRNRRQDGTALSTNEAYNTLNYALECVDEMHDLLEEEILKYTAPDD